MCLTEWASDDDVDPASIRLCDAMACSFDDKDKATRRTKLTKLLPSFGVDMQIEFPIQQTLP